MTDDVRMRTGEAAVLAALRQHGPLERGALAALTGLPRSTVGDVVARLRRTGRVDEGPIAERAPGRRGRPPVVVSLPDSGTAIAVIALTNGLLRAAVVGHDGSVHASREIEATLPDFSAGLLEPALALLAEARDEAPPQQRGFDAAVVCLPVPLDNSGVPQLHTAGRVPASLPDADRWTRAAHAEWLRTNPATAIGEALGVPAWVENDANLAALGEGRYGAARGLRDFVYVKLVVGVGAGIVLDGRLHRGRGGMAGELAHLHLAEDGPVCACGGRGCLMTQYSSPRLVDLVQHAHAHPLTLDDVLLLAEHGDRGVQRVLEDLGVTLGRSLADLCVYLDPEGIVVDGLLRGAAEAVCRGIRRTLDRYVQPQVAQRVRVLSGSLGRDAELLGAAVLAQQTVVG